MPATNVTLTQVQGIVTDALTTYEQLATVNLADATALERAEAREFASSLIRWGNTLGPLIETAIAESTPTPDQAAVIAATERTQAYLATLEG